MFTADSIIVFRPNTLLKISTRNAHLQEGGLHLSTLWIAVFLSPRKAHAFFLNSTYKYSLAVNTHY